MTAKRKPGPREPNGRPKRDRTQDALNAKNAAMSREVRAVALAQPHRRGKDDVRLSDALGRFCARHRVRAEAYDAGCIYQASARRWRLLTGAPSLAIPAQDVRDDDPRDRAEPGLGHADAAKDWDGEARRIAVRLRECDLFMSGASHDGFLAVRAAACDEIEIDDGWAEAAKAALLALAVCLGRLDAKALEGA